MSLKMTQVPVTELGKKYFDPAKGYCDFDSMRENYELLDWQNETCIAYGQVGEFTLYKSSHANNYATYKDIVIKLENNFPEIVNDLRVTDSRELAEIMASPKFNDNYIEVIDRWRKENRF